GTRVYGCDACQGACPPTVRFARSTTPDEARDTQAWVPLLELLDATDEELLREYGRWYIADRNPLWLRRNALIALGNSDAPVTGRTARTLQRYLAHDEPVMRAQAVWTAARLGLRELLPESDGDSLVV